jgi:hypothetical protein
VEKIALLGKIAVLGKNRSGEKIALLGKNRSGGKNRITRKKSH